MVEKATDPEGAGGRHGTVRHDASLSCVLDGERIVDPAGKCHPCLPVRPRSRYGRGIRKDPVQFRVAIPAADPPDNIAHDLNVRAAAGAMWLDVDFP